MKTLITLVLVTATAFGQVVVNPFRLAADPAKPDVDVFVIAGQSNASGRGDNNQVYSGSVGALLFKNNYTLFSLTDPTDSAAGQIDTISNDSALGSVWPLVANSNTAATSRKVIYIPCAKGGSSITAWLPTANHQDRVTLYGSMIFRTQTVMSNSNFNLTLRGVLWWQGETDAIAAMSTAAYQSNLTVFASNVFADIGVKVFPAKLQTSVSESGYTDANKTNINTAIGNLWNTDYVAAGPDLFALVTDDQYHLKTNAKLEAAALLWWNAIKEEFSW